MASLTRRRVASATLVGSLMARLTVAMDTPAIAATSSIVASLWCCTWRSAPAAVPLLLPLAEGAGGATTIPNAIRLSACVNLYIIQENLYIVRTTAKDGSKSAASGEVSDMTSADGTPAPSILSANRISKSFGEIPVLFSVDFD